MYQALSHISLFNSTIFWSTFDFSQFTYNKLDKNGVGIIYETTKLLACWARIVYIFIDPKASAHSIFPQL